ncbi:LexA family protein [Snodgrassella alvi]|uniref:LexA family protein n=1 Tax=Snodgrassella alvi TaxID=1196083 RepID=UPI0022AAA234|nr:S24 family peptidase [Snodgrassella alvi]
MPSYLIKNQPATIAVRCGNDSMKNAGISTGDILIIDRSLEARNSDIVMANIGTAFTIRRYELVNEIAYFNFDSTIGKFNNYIFCPQDNMEIVGVVGVVTFVIKAIR